MRLFIFKYSLILIVMSACTQAPAPIAFKGQNNFGKNGTVANQNVSSNDTIQAATVAPIGVIDLSPPAKSNYNPTNRNSPAYSAPPNSPFQHAHAPLPPEAADDNPVNPWTHQLHEPDTRVLAQDSHISANEAAVVSATKNVDTSVSQLDAVISNNSEVKSPVKAFKTPAKTDVAAAEPFTWPVASKKILSGFGPKGNGKVNDGINIASSDGEPVWAAADGEVVYVGSELQGYGNMVLIKHSGDKATSYAHLSKATVEKYDHVKQGDIVGYVGTTGNVKEPQLHFAVREGKEAVDPMKYLDSKTNSPVSN